MKKPRVKNLIVAPRNKTTQKPQFSERIFLNMKAAREQKQAVGPVGS
jgi:hypothetical protein